MGANTPKGFYSLFNELYNPYDDWNMYIIKGGPGTGKSSLMKKIKKYAAENNYKTEMIYCSSDPLSLDAVIIPELKTAIADGTSPHIINPVFPGVCEHTVDLSEYWNKDKLKTNSSEIKRITSDNSDFHKQSIKYLKAAGAIDNELKNISDNFIKKEKADRFISRLCDKYLIPSDNDTGICKKRFLSAVTPIGITIHFDSIFNTCERIINIKDNNLYISEYILNKIKEYAENKKLNRILCMCPMNPENKIDHIIFPDLNLAFFTSNIYHPLIKKTDITYTCKRFIDEDKYSEYKNKIYFLRKAKLELIGESVRCLENAKKTHDLLESYYIAAMDFRGVSEITDNIIDEIFNVSRET